MSINIKVIRFTAVLSAIFAIITYLTSVNVSYGWFDIAWLPNSFIITIVGGAFASILVVMICEIQKYLQNKKMTEKSIFHHMCFVYKELSSIKVNLNKCKCSEEMIVTEEVVRCNCDAIGSKSNALIDLDYVCFNCKNPVYLAHVQLRQWLLGELASFINSFLYIQIAINMDHISNLKNFGMEGNITYKSYYTGQTIDKFLTQIDMYIKYADEYLSLLDKSRNGQLGWSKMKEFVDYSVNLEAVGLESFLEAK